MSSFAQRMSALSAKTRASGGPLFGEIPASARYGVREGEHSPGAPAPSDPVGRGYPVIARLVRLSAVAGLSSGIPPPAVGPAH